MFVGNVLTLLFLTAKYSQCNLEVVQGRESTVYVDLDIIKSNYLNVLKKLPPKHPVLAVLKTNGYGVGDVALSQIFLELGAKYLAVAIVDEGVHLRRKGVKAPILVLGHTSNMGRGIDLAIQYNLTLNVFSTDVLDAVQNRAMLYNSEPVKIHIKVNTGLNRLGLEPNELVPFLKLIKTELYSKVIVEGVFSHFATLLDIPVTSQAEKYARNQLHIFKRVLKEARQEMEIPIAHIANSGGINLFGHAAALDMVRPGSAILGFSPHGQFSMSMTSIITAIRQPARGQHLGYEQNTTANGHQVIAAVALGYGDGLRTECGHGNGVVLVNGVRVPIVSGLMMDQMLIDVTAVYPVEVGEQVVIIGRQKGEEITIDEYTERCGGTDILLTTHLNKRLPKVYLRHGQVVYFENNLLSYDVLVE